MPVLQLSLLIIVDLLIMLDETKHGFSFLNDPSTHPSWLRGGVQSPDRGVAGHLPTYLFWEGRQDGSTGQVTQLSS